MMLRRTTSAAFVYHSDISDIAEPEESLYIANIETSNIYTLNGVGISIWELLEAPKGSDEIIFEISAIYGIEQETISESIFAFLDNLKNQGLIEDSEKRE